jgi:hypothetical protein
MRSEISISVVITLFLFSVLFNFLIKKAFFFILFLTKFLFFV